MEFRGRSTKGPMLIRATSPGNFHEFQFRPQFAKRGLRSLVWFVEGSDSRILCLYGISSSVYSVC